MYSNSHISDGSILNNTDLLNNMCNSDVSNIDDNINR